MSSTTPTPAEAFAASTPAVGEPSPVESSDSERSEVGPWRTVWRPGHEPGRRRFAAIGDLALELGTVLPDVTVCWEQYGELNDTRSNAILVLHGFTADSQAAGPAGPGHPEDGWWDEMIGAGKALDTDRFCVIVPNCLGGCQGTTGPGQLAPDGSPWGSRWPVTTIRDLVAAEVGLADALGIQRWYSMIGMSLGGMRALEWCVGYPERAERAIIIGVGPYASAEEIALQTIQMNSITEDHRFLGGDYYGTGPAFEGKGPLKGMAQARRLGHVTYRSELELHQRFGNRPQGDEVPLSAIRGSGRYGVVSYLDHAATRLERRFDPNTYLAINEAMNHHDIGRGRGGWRDAMKRITARLTIIGMEEDRLYPLRLQKALAAEAPWQDGKPVELHIIRSIVGHDAFLTENEMMSTVIAPALAE